MSPHGPDAGTAGRRGRPGPHSPATPSAASSAIASRLASKTSTSPPPLQCRPSPSGLGAGRAARRQPRCAGRFRLTREKSARPRTARRRLKPRRALRSAAATSPERGSGACRKGRPRSDWRGRANASRRRTVPPRPWRRRTRSPPRGAERGERALGEARALLHERQHRLRHAVVEPGQGSGRRAVDAGDAQDLLDDVGLDLDVGAPGGRRETRPRPRRQSRAGARIASPSSRGISTPSSRFTSLYGKGTSAAAPTDRPPRSCAKARRRRSTARAQSRDRSRGRRSRDRRRVRTDSARRSMIPSLRPVCAMFVRVPQRAFDQNVARRLVAAGMLAAHDAGDRFDAVLVGDDAPCSRRARRSCRRARARSRRRGRGGP